MVDEELAIEVVDFVLERPGVEALAGGFEGLAVDVAGLYLDPRIALDIAIEVGEAQTALGGRHELFGFSPDLRIQHHEWLAAMNEP